MSRILLAEKTTVWHTRSEWFTEQFKKGFLAEKDYKRIHDSHFEHIASVEKAEEAFARAGINVLKVNVDDQSWSIPDDVSVVVTMGGDGTLLSASHRIGETESRVVLVGLRSSGTSVGYLCAGGLERMQDVVESVKVNTFQTYMATRSYAEIRSTTNKNTVTRTPPALNDFLYSHANPAATTRYVITLGDRTEEHKSSGLWVSTALGSTAGISAAGGVVQPRTDRNFQYVVRELYRAPGKNFYLVNGFFDAEKRCLSLENRCDRAILAADGNHSLTEIGWGDIVTFKRAPSIKIAT